MRLLNHIYARVVLPMFPNEGFRGHSRYWNENARRERASLQQNEERQWADLKKLLSHAYRSTAFYKERFDSAGFRPEDLKFPEQLAKLPPLTRDDIKHHLRELRSTNFSDVELAGSATGGTTDAPVPFFRDRACLPKKLALQMRLNAWAGMFPGDKVLYLWGARQDWVEEPSWRWRIYDRYLMRRVWAPTSLLNNTVFESYRQSLNRFKPDVIYAYPVSLNLFCEYLRDTGLPVHKPRTAICTAEPLLNEYRVLIQDVLGCPVFEHYGSREFGMIAGECEAHEGLHFVPGAAYVEFVPLPGDSELHEIFVTDLLNFGMPLIRYQSNDCAVLAKRTCPCGCGYPLMTRQIVGRVSDNLILPNGDVIAGVCATSRIVEACPGLKKTQIIQQDLNRFTLRYVPSESFSAEDLAALRKRLDQFIPISAHWEFQAVAEIAREASGKTRHCVCKVPRSAVERAMQRSTSQP